MTFLLEILLHEKSCSLAPRKQNKPCLNGVKLQQLQNDNEMINGQKLLQNQKHLLNLFKTITK